MKQNNKEIPFFLSLNSKEKAHIKAAFTCYSTFCYEKIIESNSEQVREACVTILAEIKMLESKIKSNSETNE
jgi:hypothetical protein